MKAKSNSAIKKRVRITGTGKVKVQKSCRNHLLMQKSKKQKNLGKHPQDVTLSVARKVKKNLNQ